MNVVPQVTCRRCGESFSAVRSTCPHCGTRRTGESTRSPQATSSNNRTSSGASRADTNMKWQFIFGLILVVAVILAVIVMVSTGLSGTDNTKNRPSAPTPTVVNNAQPTPETPPTPPPTPTPVVQNIEVRYVTTTYNDKDFTMQIGETLQLNAQVWPADLVNLSDVTWSSSKPEIVKIRDNHDGTVDLECLDTTSGKGPVTITAECFGKTAKVMVYCREAS